MIPKLVIDKTIRSASSSTTQSPNVKLREKVDGLIETVDELLKKNEEMRAELEELKNMI